MTSLLSLLSIRPPPSTDQIFSGGEFSYISGQLHQIFYLRKLSPISCHANVIPLYLTPSILVLSTFNASMISLSHISKKPLTPSMTALVLPSIPLPFTFSHLKPIPHHIWTHTFLYLSFPLCLQPMASSIFWRSVLGHGPQFWLI